jgi:hypothetical protein
MITTLSVATGVVRSRVIWSVVATLLLMSEPGRTTQNTASTLPGRLEAYLTKTVKVTPDQRQRLLKGEPLVTLLPGDDTKEVGVLGAIWINASIHSYVAGVTDIENFEKGGGFKVTKRISTPPRLEDFARLSLPDDDLLDLRSCQVGDCDLKLGEEALRRFRALNWNAPEAKASANAVMQRLAVEYVTNYLAGGNARLAVYRDASRPTFVADEFRGMIDGMPELTTYMPDVRSYRLNYPKATLPGGTSFVYWQETEFGLKPTLRISHLTIRETPQNALVVSKMLYASHYFWTGVELRVLVPDPSRGAGFWFLAVSRSRSDGLSGFTGMFIRSRARSEVENGARTGLQVTKKLLEASR